MLQLCVQTHAGAFTHSHRPSDWGGGTAATPTAACFFFTSGEAELMFNSSALEGKLVEHSAGQLLSVKAARFK